jgi:DNA-binding CsgD family transcriptional regulator
VHDERTSYDVWGAAIALQAALATLLGLVLIFLWGLTGAGYFWPKWVLFGLAVPLTIQLAIRLALRVGEDRRRALALHAVASGWIAAVLVAIYALAGGGTFWPLWVVATLALALGAHAIVVVAWPSLRPQERELEARVDVLTRTRAGALDVQAAELRRIERDLHDGAQARLVALSMQLGRAEERLEGQHVEPVYTAELLESGEGGIGYLLKERVGDVRGFVDAVQRVARGGTALDREVVAELVRSRTGQQGEGALAALTPREREVLELMAEGRTNAAIARAMVVTPGAVEKHVSSIFGKLDLPSTDDDHRRVLAVLAYLRAA